MQKIFVLTLLVLLASIPVLAADDHPKAEIFLGYTYMRANSATNVPAFSANGGGGQLAVNFNKVVGFVVDVGATHNGNINSNHLDSTFSNALFGPRISIRHHRVIPYFHALFGGVHASNSIPVISIPVPSTQPLPGFPEIPPGQPVTLRATASQTAFAWALGGGVDIKINKHAAFRPLGVDYFMTRLQNYRSAEDNNQHNIRVTAGINFTFGAQ